MKILFVRYTEGVYHFGSKKISLKLEKNELKVRVGGGYLGLEEFLDQNINVELEKIDKMQASLQNERRQSSVNFGGKSVTGLGVIPESPNTKLKRASIIAKSKILLEEFPTSPRRNPIAEEP